MRRLFDGDRRPRRAAIHFGVGTGELLGAMAAAGGDAIGIDWRVPLDAAWGRVGGPARARAGQPRPDACCWRRGRSSRHRRSTCWRRAGGRDGHVFNLGHGVLPTTPVEHLQRLVDLVHERTER